MGLRTILLYTYPYRGPLLLVVVLSLVGSLATLLIPWLASQFLGGIATGTGFDVSSVVVLLVTALIVLTGLTITSAVTSSRIAAQIEADLRGDIYAHVQRLPLAFFDTSQQGDLLALMTWEVSRLSSFVSNTLTRVPAALFVSVGAISILLAIDPIIALLAPICIPLYVIILKTVGRGLRNVGVHWQQAEAAMFSAAEQDLSMIPAIKSFGTETKRLESYRERLESVRSHSFENARIEAWLGPIVSLVTALAAVALLLLASQNSSGEPQSPEELFSILLYAALLTRPVGVLANLYGQFRNVSGTLERLQTVRKEKTEPGYQAVQQASRAGELIAFRNVSFAYQGRIGTLNNISFEIQPGETVAVVGANGSGKTTIVNLLLGFYRPKCGSIHIGSKDLTELQIRSHRKTIGYVPQRPLLFNGSVRDNIAFDRDWFGQNDIEKAAKLAQAHDFIEQLPRGYDTRIGDHGVQLSGGQRQRLALARALLADPPILILDEATSMYDLDAEAAFVEQCATALRDRTVLLITHRPASLALADRSIEIDAGKIVADRAAATRA